MTATTHIHGDIGVVIQPVQNKDSLVIPTSCYSVSGSTGVKTMNAPGTVSDGSVTVAKMADLARGSILVGVASDHVLALDAKTSGKILVGDGTDLKSVAVSGDATLAANGAITIANDAVTAAKLNYTVETVTIVGAASGTTTVTSGAQILGFYVTAITGTERVNTVNIDATTLTVTLTGSDTATIKVVVLEP